MTKDRDDDMVAVGNEVLRVSGEFVRDQLTRFAGLLNASLVGGPHVMQAFDQEMAMVNKRMIELCETSTDWPR